MRLVCREVFRRNNSCIMRLESPRRLAGAAREAQWKQSHSLVLTAQENSAESANKRPLVLVVDDDPAILRLMEMIHVYLQIDIQTAETAEAALEFSKPIPSMLCCSTAVCRWSTVLNLPPLWRKYEKQAGMKSLPIIAITALRNEQAESRCWNAGMDAYISKPLDVNTLKSTLEQMLEKRNGKLNSGKIGF